DSNSRKLGERFKKNNQKTLSNLIFSITELVQNIEETGCSVSVFTERVISKTDTADTFLLYRNGSLPSRPAGSSEDNKMGNDIFKQFKDLGMQPWTDRHYVQLQKQDSKNPNRVMFGSDTFQPTGYLAYSRQGKVEGKVVYGNYGRPEDLDVLLKKNISLAGCVLLLRAGRTSFAQKVANAAEKGASAVLIYPDSADHRYDSDIELYGHVHLGSGDPYTPGFPSFNHTQFPPAQSSGLPTILAQTITAMNNDFKGKMLGSYKLGGVMNITVEVNNVLVNTEIHNVFGVIKGFIDPDRYVVLGAQRDAWGQGYARAYVGTTILTELAKAVHEMVEKDGFRPRRSLIFASWSAGEYGSVGATEWLEGYMSSLDKKALTYINLDGAVMGRGGFIASASPLLYSLIENATKQVDSPYGSGSVYNAMGATTWEEKVLRPMEMNDPAYPFLAFSGIPSISFHFINPRAYPYYGTDLDTWDHFSAETNHHNSEMVAAAGQLAGQMALRLVHDHLLKMDVTRYGRILTAAVGSLYSRIRRLTQLKGVTHTWLTSARGSFMRAASSINNDILNTDLTDKEAGRIINDRIMMVEQGFLSPYVSPKETPFRHVLLGRGAHTLAAISKCTNMTELRTQLALATWTLQGCANSMVGDIWDIDNNI
uniref:Transferrin receptor 1b n=1 Tax=Myripristis murdjan TaxID=586833 RepID=A0A668A2V9_9TELE